MSAEDTRENDLRDVYEAASGAARGEPCRGPAQRLLSVGRVRSSWPGGLATSSRPPTLTAVDSRTGLIGWLQSRPALARRSVAVLRHGPLLALTSGIAGAGPQPLPPVGKGPPTAGY
jgi:hypothetical protein